MNKGLAGVVLATAALASVGIGCAQKGTPIKTTFDDHVLFKRSTYGSKSIELKITDQSGLPYCEPQVAGISCEIPLEYLKQPRFNMMTVDEAFGICRYSMRYARPTYWDVQACSVELMSMSLNELREPTKSQ